MSNPPAAMTARAANVLGMRTDMGEAFHFIDENSILYAAGNNVVVFNKEHKTIKFQPLTDRGDGIANLTVSPDKHLLAVSERSNMNMPFIVIYDMFSMRKRKSLSFGVKESRAKEFSHVAFSNDSKFCVAVLGEPEYILHYYLWEKGKLFALHSLADELKASASGSMHDSIRETRGEKYPHSQHSGSNPAQGGQGGATTTAPPARIRQISVNPFDSTTVCVVADSVVKILKYKEGDMVDVPLDFGLTPVDQMCRFRSHAWLSIDRLVVGTANGDIFIFSNNRLAQTLRLQVKRLGAEGTFPSSSSNSSAPATTAHSAAPASNTLSATPTIVTTPVSSSLAGDRGIQPMEVEQLARINAGFLAGGTGGVVVAFNAVDDEYREWRRVPLPDRDMGIKCLAVSPEGETCLLAVDKAQLLGLRVSTLDSAKPDEIRVDALSQSYHHGAVIGLDSCCRKPVIVTCSTDRSIRVWNYTTGTCELLKYFPEDALSVSLHPSGLYILVGFTDKLRLMSFLIDDLRLFREFSIRGCRECRFSNGGQYFAATNGNMIQIFNTWTFDNIANLKGHNGKVRSLQWTPDDNMLVSAGTDGAVYLWDVRGVKRESEHILKNCTYSSAVCSRDGRTVWTVGTDRMLKEISDSVVTREVDYAVVYTQLVLSHSGRMMFAGTAAGAVRAIKFPLTGDNHDFQEHHGHCGPITKLRMSYDDQHLFSVGEDGCIYIYRVIDKEDRLASRAKERAVFVSDEILVTKSDLEEKAITMGELQRSLEEMKLEHEYQLRLKDMSFAEKMKEISDKYSQEIEALKISAAVLRTEKDKEEVRHEEEISVLKESHVEELHDRETSYNQQLMDEYEKYQELQSRAARLQQSWEKQMRELEKDHQRVLSVSTAEYEWKLRAKTNEINKLRDEMRNKMREFAEVQRQNEEDIDQEILAVDARYEKKLKAEREESARLKGENGIMRKKFTTLNKEIEDNKAEIAKMHEDEKKLQAVIAALEKEIAGLKKEMSERDEMIQDKERKVYDLKKKNQELEKYKFVLDYRIKEIKRQIEPRENDIAEMTAHIGQINFELEDLNKRKIALEETISGLRAELGSTKSEYQRQHHRLHEIVRGFNRMKKDLADAIDYIQEPAVLKKCFEAMHATYCAHVAQEQGVDPAVADEVERQTAFLTTTITALRSHLDKNIKIFNVDRLNTLRDNQELLGEIKNLRPRNKFRGEEAHMQTLKQLIVGNNDTLPAITKSGPHRPNSAMKG